MKELDLTKVETVETPTIEKNVFTFVNLDKEYEGVNIINYTEFYGDKETDFKLNMNVALVADVIICGEEQLELAAYLTGMTSTANRGEQVPRTFLLGAKSIFTPTIVDLDQFMSTL